MSPFIAAVVVLVFAFIVEFLQYIQIIKKLELEHSIIAKTVIGTSFSWADMLAYTFGCLFVLLVENCNYKKVSEWKRIIS